MLRNISAIVAAFSGYLRKRQEKKYILSEIKAGRTLVQPCHMMWRVCRSRIPGIAHVKRLKNITGALMILACSSCGCRDTVVNEPRDPVAAEIRELAGAHVRVVWAQDIGDGSDTFADGNNLRLMGYDSEDGLGERALLSEPSNYSRPLITPRGDRVVFSTRGADKIYIVNWDGTGLTELADGLAVSVWSDPKDGTEWVYAGTPIEGAQRVTDLRRFPVDTPEAGEPVWNKTPLEINNVQLSADGRQASGAFPWPACGIADLPNIGWKKYARGCWPSLAPDDSGLLWIFDGSHRNLTLFSPDPEEQWVVNINSAPGVDGHEVYHPRWSNHPRIMTMTGPYTVGASANRIRGGGADVEIYVGRFSDDFRHVDRWARVTQNEYANFYPDVWVKMDARVPAATRKRKELRLEAAHAAWPGDMSGLEFLWDNRAKENEIKDAEGTLLRTCRAEPAGLARYGRFFDMDLADGIFIAETGSDALFAQCRNSNTLAIEAVITPGRTDLQGFAGIISFGQEANRFNFTLGQKENRLVFRDGAASREYDLFELAAGKPHHVIVSLEPDSLSYFLDGVRKNEPLAVQNDFSGWIEGRFVFGDADREGWPGYLEGIALYSRAIGEREALEKYTLSAGRFEDRVPPPRLLVEARLAEASGIPTPESIAPYRSALAANIYDVVEVLEGTLPDRRVMIAHWVILDGRVLDTAKREPGSVQRMSIEPFDKRPELEGERLVMDSDEFALPMYYDLGL